jgi:hypothetical protein
MFQSNTMLELTGTILTTFQMDFSQFLTLNQLNLDHNQIHALPPMTYSSLTALSAHNESCQLPNCSRLEVNLDHNDLLCGCETKAFVTWLQGTALTFTGSDTYTCTYRGQVTNITDSRIHGDVCTAWRAVAIATGTIAALVTGIVVTLICKMKQSKRRAKMQLKLAIERYRHDPNEYLVFLAYSHHDKDVLLSEIYPRLLLKLQEALGSTTDLVYISDKHFRLGTYIVNEIARAISASHVIVLFVSDAFLRSSYCELESYIAFEEKKPIVLLFRKEIEGLRKKMPPIFRRIYSKWARNIWPTDGTQDEQEFMLDQMCKSVLQTYADNAQGALEVDDAVARDADLLTDGSHDAEDQFCMVDVNDMDTAQLLP